LSTCRSGRTGCAIIAGGPLGPGRSLWPRRTFVSAQREQRHRRRLDALSRRQRGAVDADLEKAHIGTECPGAEVEFHLKQSIFDRHVVADDRPGNLAAADQAVVQREFDVGQSCKRHAGLLQLTLVGNGTLLGTDSARAHGYHQQDNQDYGTHLPDSLPGWW